MQPEIIDKKFSYKEAYSIAANIIELLQPYSIRCEIAGSIRRKKSEVKDIEIVCIPKPYQTGLFQDGIAEVVNQWQKVKGELEYGGCKYTQRILPQGIKLDLFFAEKENWGLIFAIRTGSAEYSHKILANAWVKKGYKSEGGYLFQNGKKFEVHEEKDLFKRIGVEYVAPEHRNI